MMSDSFDQQAANQDHSVEVISAKDHGRPDTPGAVPRTNTIFHNIRYVLIFLAGMISGCMLLSRLSITVAMLSMVNHTQLYLMEHQNSTVEDFFPEDYVEVGEFTWTNEIQQMIMAGYMIAYTIPQFFTTRLTMKLGLRSAIPIWISLIAMSVLITPAASHFGWQWVLALRFLNGFSASAIIPSMIGAVEKWMPYNKSASGIVLLQFVQGLLGVFTPLISGYLTAIHWKWAFYVPGALNLSFAVIWYILATDNIESNRYVSQKEIDLIKGDGSAGEDKLQKDSGYTSDLPWYFVFKIKNFYALALLWSLYCVVSGGFLFLLPAYLNRVLKVPVEDIGLYSFVTQSSGLIYMLWSNPTTNFLQNRFGLSLTAARNVIQLICAVMSILSWGLMAAFHSHQIVAIFINRFFCQTHDILITVTLMSQYGKEGVSSLVYSMMNTIGNFASVLFCWAAGRMLDITGESLECWSWIYIVMSAFMVLMSTLYIFFISSEPVSIKRQQRTVAD